MKKLTYVTEKGDILFHPDGYPSDKGLTIKQLAKNKRWKTLNKIARQLANYEQSDNIKQSIKLSNDITLYYVNFRWSKCHKGIERDGYSYECNHCNDCYDYGCSSKKEYYIDTINFIYISNKKDIGKQYFFYIRRSTSKIKGSTKCLNIIYQQQKCVLILLVHSI